MLFKTIPLETEESWGLAQGYIAKKIEEVVNKEMQDGWEFKGASV